MDFDRDKCLQRNRIAAKRDGVDAVPFSFVGDPSSRAPIPRCGHRGDSGAQYSQVGEGRHELHDLNGLQEATDSSVVFGSSRTAAEKAVNRNNRQASGSWGEGAIKGSTDDEMEQINALLPEGAPALRADDVYIHYMEAANGNFVPDRYMFMDSSTLKNIAKNASDGIAFMNSHRTGSMSHPAELPMGKSFMGQFKRTKDEDGVSVERAVVGIYMLRGSRPNGSTAPTTDEMHAGIRGGTISDVSVGLYGGSRICDVCGNDINDYDACAHVPGTSYGMDESEMKAQKSRGVPDGCCSYTLVGAACGEVSAVYDGAVPGAGFRKALAFRKEMPFEQLAQAHRAYGKLSKGEIMDPITETIKDAFREGFAALKGHVGLGKSVNTSVTQSNGGEYMEPAEVAVSAPSAWSEIEALKVQNAQLSASITAMQVALATQQAEFAASRHEADKVANIAAVRECVRLGKMTSAEGESWTVLAKDNPSAFAAALPTLQARTPLAQFGVSRERGGISIVPDASDPGAKLAALTTEYAKANTVSFSKAASIVTRANPDLAAAHQASARRVAGGSN